MCGEHEQGFGGWNEFEKLEGRRGVQPGRKEGLGKGRRETSPERKPLESISASLFKAISKAFVSAQATHPQ